MAGKDWGRGAFKIVGMTGGAAIRFNPPFVLTPPTPFVLSLSKDGRWLRGEARRRMNDRLRTANQTLTGIEQRKGVGKDGHLSRAIWDRLA